MGDSLTRTMAERCRELEDAGDAPAGLAQRDAAAARLAARRAPPPPPRRRSCQTATSRRQVTPGPVRSCISPVLRYYAGNQPHPQGRRPMAPTTRTPG